MSTPIRLTLFSLGLVAAFFAAIGLGSVTGPVGPAASDDRRGGHTPAKDDNADEHGEGHSEQAVTAPLGGLAVSSGGYTLDLASTVLPAAEPAALAFRVLDEDGEPLTAYTRTHDKDLHLVVVRRDTQHFQHVHPQRDAVGTWSLPLTLPEAGPYKVYVDFQPKGADKPVVLAADLTVPGDYQPDPVPAAEAVTKGAGYSVRLDGQLEPGRASTITLSLTRGGQPVTDLQPYLGAFGHVVVLRDGDLAYLHVHPREDGSAGPDLTFEVDVPTPGRYRLFLDFQHQSRVRTAPFTVLTTGAS